MRFPYPRGGGKNAKWSWGSPLNDFNKWVEAGTLVCKHLRAFVAVPKVAVFHSVMINVSSRESNARYASHRRQSPVLPAPKGGQDQTAQSRRNARRLVISERQD